MTNDARTTAITEAAKQAAIDAGNNNTDDHIEATELFAKHYSANGGGCQGLRAQAAEEVDESLDNIRTIFANREMGSCRDVALQCYTPDEAKCLVEDALGDVEMELDNFFSGGLTGDALKESITSTIKQLAEAMHDKVAEVRGACQELRAIAGKRGDMLREIEREL